MGQAARLSNLGERWLDNGEAFPAGQASRLSHVYQLLAHLWRPEKSVLFTRLTYNDPVEKKIFWIVFILLGLVVDFVLPLWWGLVATIPIAVVSWWVAYRSEWF